MAQNEPNYFTWVLRSNGFWIVYIQDELLWAAAWLYHATDNQYYLSYLGNNGDSMGGTGWSMTEFGWDVKYAGVQTLVSKVLHVYNNHYKSLTLYNCNCGC